MSTKEKIKEAIYQIYQTTGADITNAIGHEPSGIEVMEAACGLDMCKDVSTQKAFDCLDYNEKKKLFNEVIN